jgi:hypothetical protein
MNQRAVAIPPTAVREPRVGWQATWTISNRVTRPPPGDSLRPETPASGHLVGGKHQASVAGDAQSGGPRHVGAPRHRIDRCRSLLPAADGAVGEPNPSHELAKPAPARPRPDPDIDLITRELGRPGQGAARLCQGVGELHPIDHGDMGGWEPD